MIAFSFVSFVLFVVENAFVVHLLFLVAASPRWALHGKRALFFNPFDPRHPWPITPLFDFMPAASDPILPSNGPTRMVQRSDVRR